VKTASCIVLLYRSLYTCVAGFEICFKQVLGRWAYLRNQPDWLVQSLSYLKGDGIESIVEEAKDEWRLRKRRRNTQRFK
jgi:hypothetical protein